MQISLKPKTIEPFQAPYTQHLPKVIDLIFFSLNWHLPQDAETIFTPKDFTNYMLNVSSADLMLDIELKNPMSS